MGKSKTNKSYKSEPLKKIQTFNITRKIFNNNAI